MFWILTFWGCGVEPVDTAVGVCLAGQSRCAGSSIEACIGGMYEPIATCDDTCSNADGYAVCFHEEPTAPTPSNSNAPVLSGFSADMPADNLEFRFVVTDVDGNLEGGQLQVDVGESPVLEYAIPSQLAEWNPGGVSVAYAIPNSCFYGETVAFGARVRDPSARLSAHLTSTVTLPGSHVLGYENGDANDIEIDPFALPTGVCGGALDAVGNDGASYVGDLDWFVFVAPVSQSATFRLIWSSASDYDLILFDSLGTQLDGAYEGSSPESYSHALVAGETYYMAVAGWSGTTGAYDVRVY